VVLHHRGGAASSLRRWCCVGRASPCRHDAPSHRAGVLVALVRRGGRVRAIIVASWWHAIPICGGGGVVWSSRVAVLTPPLYVGAGGPIGGAGVLVALVRRGRWSRAVIVASWCIVVRCRHCDTACLCTALGPSPCVTKRWGWVKGGLLGPLLACVVWRGVQSCRPPCRHRAQAGGGGGSNPYASNC
jgi:hypothetical protein